MAKKQKRTEDDILNEIYQVCDDLQSKGVDLSNMKIKLEKPSSSGSELYAEFDIVRKQLLNSGVDLSNCRIVCYDI